MLSIFGMDDSGHIKKTDFFSAEHFYSMTLVMNIECEFNKKEWKQKKNIKKSEQISRMKSAYPK